MPLNLPSQISTTAASVFDGLSTSVQTVGAAMALWTERLRRMLDARACLLTCTATGQIYQAVLGSTTVTFTFTSLGAFPLQVQYSRPHDTGSATFDNFEPALTWLVERLH